MESKILSANVTKGVTTLPRVMEPNRLESGFGQGSGPSALTDRGSEHRELRGDDFWKAIPAYHEVGTGEFQTHKFQSLHTVTTVPQLAGVLKGLVSESFLADVEAGLRRAPMALRIS